MVCRWPMFAAIVFLGCTRPSRVEVEYEAPIQTSTKFERLPSILAGIQKSGDISLYEGLPSEFWEPQLLEQELDQKKTIKLHGYPFYEERLAFRGTDAERFTALLSARRSFMPFRGPKECGGYHPDYCIEWKTGGAATHALICLECGDVKLFGPRGELYCNLGHEAGQKLAQLLRPYRKNRPATESGP